MSKNNTSQAKSYTHIFKTENRKKDNDHITIITMINVVNYIDKKEE